MTEQITITATIDTSFNNDDFGKALIKNNAEEKKTNSEYEHGKWTVKGVNITLYEKKLVIQTVKDELLYPIIKGICEFKGVNLDKENRNKISSFLPKTHNSIICKSCNSPSRTIEASISGLQIKFVHNCGHLDQLNSPLYVLNNRILPDVNVLVSNSLSRLIELGFFEGFEIIIPKFIMNVSETLGGAKKSGISNEITKLKSLEDGGRIKVMHYGDANDKESIEKMLHKEDEIIGRIADETNAILVTGDNLFKSNRELDNRPVISIPQRLDIDIKTIHEAIK